MAPPSGGHVLGVSIGFGILLILLLTFTILKIRDRNVSIPIQRPAVISPRAPAPSPVPSGPTFDIPYPTPAPSPSPAFFAPSPAAAPSPSQQQQQYATLTPTDESSLIDSLLDSFATSLLPAVLSALAADAADKALVPDEPDIRPPPTETDRRPPPTETDRRPPPTDDARQTRINQAKAAAANEKNATKKALKKSGQNFTSRMKAIFPRLSIQTQAKLGTHWARTARTLGTDISQVAALQASQQTGELAARMGAQKATAVAAEMAARRAATTAAGPIGLAYDAITVVGMALDLTDVGHFMQVTQTSDLLKSKEDFDTMYQNIQIDCTSIPFGPNCPAETPEGLENRIGNFPNFYGPLDTLAKNFSVEEYLDLQTSNTNAIIMSTDPEAVAIKTRTLTNILSGKPAGCGPVWSDTCSTAIPAPITDEDFLLFYPAYISDEDAAKLAEMTTRKMCADNGGISFMAGPTYSDMICSYKDISSCHAAAPWPKPSDDSEDYTYTEWRAKNYFSQFKNADGTTRLDMKAIPSGGACTTQLDALHLMCDTEKDRTAAGESLKGTYNRETGECYNIERYCDIKGVSYNPSMQPTQMGNRGSGPLPSCYIGTNQQILESIIGSGTIYRFFESPTISQGLAQIAYTPPRIDSSDVNSGNAEVDAAIVGLTNGLGTTVGAITNILSDVAIEQNEAARDIAQAFTNAALNPIVNIFNGNTSGVGTNVTSLGTGAVNSAEEFGNSLANGDVAGALGAGVAMVGQFGATALAAVTAPAQAIGAGTVSSLMTIGTGDGEAAFNNLQAQANNIENSANQLANATSAAQGAAAFSAVLSQSAGLAAAAVTAPIAAAIAEVSSAVIDYVEEITVNPVQAINNNVNNVVGNANNVEQFGQSGNTNAATLAALETAGSAFELSAATAVAGVALALEAAENYVTNVANNPIGSVNNAVNNVVNNANDVQQLGQSGNTNAATVAALETVGATLQLSSTAVVSGLVQAGEAIRCTFTACPPAPIVLNCQRRWSDCPKQCDGDSTTKQTYTEYPGTTGGRSCASLPATPRAGETRPCGQQACPAWSRGVLDPTIQDDFTSYGSFWQFCLNKGRQVELDYSVGDEPISRDVVKYGCDDALTWSYDKLAPFDPNCVERGWASPQQCCPNAVYNDGQCSPIGGYTRAEEAARIEREAAQQAAQQAQYVQDAENAWVEVNGTPFDRYQYCRTSILQYDDNGEAYYDTPRDCASVEWNLWGTPAPSEAAQQRLDQIVSERAAEAERVRQAAAAAAAAAEAERVRQAAAAAAAAEAERVRLATCPAGKYRVGTGNCVDCPVNTYKTGTSALLSDCKACPTKSTAPAGSTSDVCTCNFGYASVNGACTAKTCTGRTYLG